MDINKAIDFLEKTKEALNEKDLKKLIIMKDFCILKYENSEVRDEVLEFIDLCILKVEEYYTNPQVEDVKLINNQEELDEFKIRIGRNKVKNREQIVDFYKKFVNSIIA